VPHTESQGDHRAPSRLQSHLPGRGQSGWVWVSLLWRRLMAAMVE
jgi:hypothetical protein